MTVCKYVVKRCLRLRAGFGTSLLNMYNVPSHLSLGAQEVLSASRRPPLRLRLSTTWQPHLAAHAPSLKRLEVFHTLGLTIDGALVASLALQVGSVHGHMVVVAAGATTSI
jgi:hypothetical protein